MKYIFLVLVAVIFVTSAQAQTQTVAALDTAILGVSSTHTVTVLSGNKKVYDCAIQVQSDSISGANAGTVTLETSNDKTGSKWVTLQTMTIDGGGAAATDEVMWEFGTAVYAVRVRTTTPVGARVTNLYVASFCRDRSYVRQQ